MDGDSSSWAALAMAGVALLGMILLSAAEGALATISRTRLKELHERGVGGAGTALALIEDEAALRGSLRLLNRVLAALLLVGTLTWGTRALAVALLCLLLLPPLANGLGVRWYHVLAPRLAPLVRAATTIISPLRAALDGLGRWVAGSTRGRDNEQELRQDEEELRALVAVAGDDADEIDEEGREMIQSILSLAQTTARELMVPRPDIFALPQSATLREALDLVIEEGHSRTPVYEGTIDNIVGILYAKDLLAAMRDGTLEQPLSALLRAPLFVPASRHADGLLNDLQSSRVHMAIVFDEYGGTAGIVTIEDVLEEIVGEIQDEYDAEEASFTWESEASALVSGLLDIDDLNDEMGLDLPTDTNDTVGGLIYSALGRVPLVGDEVLLEPGGLGFQVLAMTGRRIARVRVRRLPTLDPSDDGAANGDASPSSMERLRALLF